MKTAISKSVRHSLLVEDGDLTSLFNFISSKYAGIEIVSKCVDGSRLETKDGADLIAFENPNYRKIKSIRIEANNGVGERLSLNIDSEMFFSVATLDLSSESDEQALYISQEVLKKLADMKPGYDLLARASILNIVFGIWFTFGMFVTLGQFIGAVPSVQSKLSSLEIINSAILVAVILYAITTIADKGLHWLFPKVFFLIGRQKKTMDSIKKWRSFLFGGILLTLIIGVIVNLITKWF